MKTIRASALNLAQFCFGQHALDKLHDVETEWTARGKAIHADIEQLVAGKAMIETAKDLCWDRAGFMAWAREEFLGLGRDGGGSEAAAWIILGGVKVTGTMDHIEYSVPRVVFDWKSGEGILLGPIATDWQMIAYAVMSGAVESITVHRVLVEKLEYESLTLDADDLKAAAEAIEEIATNAVNNPDVRTVGAHCDHCLMRTHCPEYIEQGEPLAIMLKPSMAIADADHARRLAVSLLPVKKALEAAEKALRDYVGEHGPIVTNGQRWGPSARYTDEIVDPQALMSLLGGTLNTIGGKPLRHAHGYAIALAAQTTTKGMIEAPLKVAWQTAADIEGFWALARERGAVVRSEGVQWRWKKRRTINV